MCHLVRLLPQTSTSKFTHPNLTLGGPRAARQSRPFLKHAQYLVLRSRLVKVGFNRCRPNWLVNLETAIHEIEIGDINIMLIHRSC